MAASTSQPDDLSLVEADDVNSPERPSGKLSRKRQLQNRASQAVHRKKEKQINELTTSLNESHEKLEALTKQVHTLLEEKSRLGSILADKMCDLTELRAQTARLEETIGRLREQCAQLQQEKLQLGQDNALLGEHCERLEQDKTDLRWDIAVLEHDKAELNARLELFSIPFFEGPPGFH